MRKTEEPKDKMLFHIFNYGSARPIAVKLGRATGFIKNGTKNLIAGTAHNNYHEMLIANVSTKKSITIIFWIKVIIQFMFDFLVLLSENMLNEYMHRKFINKS